ncbi:hypothetical protein BHF71_07230 [Vulcanibacillus modesticaldus]|uniref:Uncharacterized protein n=1 Tax=Vulcanibacillus modesticaldus TaxID=337097 RepID=A0A1D2YW75_9BACI|nr:hypothetical protein [Vulcanibacillus modesticaldus]OEF99896.1 hypothetical protein BHF71_07230 [Vulcanibacillus modesticaldus]
MKIKIGADEIILWLRKNGKAVNKPNDGYDGLGLKIYDLIVNQLNGVKIDDNVPSYWPVNSNFHIGEDELPKSSAQYLIDIDKLKDLYTNISRW